MKKLIFPLVVLSLTFPLAAAGRKVLPMDPTRSKRYEQLVGSLDEKDRKAWEVFCEMIFKNEDVMENKDWVQYWRAFCPIRAERANRAWLPKKADKADMKLDILQYCMGWRDYLKLNGPRALYWGKDKPTLGYVLSTNSAALIPVLHKQASMSATGSIPECERSFFADRVDDLWAYIEQMRVLYR